MNLSERLKLARSKAGLTQSMLAEKVGIAQTAISQLESGKTLRSSYLIQIAQACAVNSLWLQSGEGEMEAPEDQAALTHAVLNEIFTGEHDEDAHRNFAMRERIEALKTASRYAPSNSLLNVEVPYLIEFDDPETPGRTKAEVSATASVHLSEDILKKQGVDHAKSIAVAISGNAMSPVLNDGSTVAADMGDTIIADGNMYVFEHMGLIKVRVLYRLPGGGIRVRSYNSSEHPDEFYSYEEVIKSQILVVGRVFWGATFF
ncbi:S24 family peptidase [Pseudomonas sp. D3]|uniref:XRE family transcriptional regulator n=1 Tax=Pseudomonas sp. D3 TaxID=517398 RepID=UPI0023E3AD7F|nr:S24 family peptidase [Pseudomonas sp. D3]WET08897.1 S24 family peptidase [Pseudomonas sp. D3]